MPIRLITLASALSLALAGAGAAAAAPAAASSTTVHVTAKDFSFALSTKTVKHGRIVFSIKNAGHSAHNFAIHGHTSKTIAPGKTTTLTVTLAPGRYPYKCSVDSHAELGMKGTLRVT
jgi:plastocyanin